MNHDEFVNMLKVVNDTYKKDFREGLSEEEKKDLKIFIERLEGNQQMYKNNPKEGREAFYKEMMLVNELKKSQIKNER